jgi:hypothetical protein
MFKALFTLAMFAAKMLVIMTMAIFTSASLGDVATNRSNPVCSNVAQRSSGKY